MDAGELPARVGLGILEGVTRNVLQAVIGTVLLLAPAAAFAQAEASSSSTGTTSSVQTVRPVAPVAPRIGVQVRTPPAATAQADL
jgi:hypothetical protein